MMIRSWLNCSNRKRKLTRCQNDDHHDAPKMKWREFQDYDDDFLADPNILQALWLVKVLMEALAKTDHGKFPEKYKSQVIPTPDVQIAVSLTTGLHRANPGINAASIRDHRVQIPAERQFHSGCKDPAAGGCGEGQGCSYGD